MKIVLASSNKGKIKEIQELIPEYEVVAFADLLGDIEIEENGNSFKENAIIKAKAIYEKLNDKNAIVVSDDSGISVDALSGAPGIYSARYSGKNATDKENNEKLINELKNNSMTSSTAHYTCAIAIASKYGIQTAHGWMYGSVSIEPKGKNGFGYDPLFTPIGYDKTIAELPIEIKKELSHRSKALKLAKIIIESIKE